MNDPPILEALRIDLNNYEPEAAVERLLEHAADLRVSDLFLTTNENHLAVLVRHLGLLRRLSLLPLELGKRCIAHIKAMSGMDVTERRRPQDGRWIYRRANKQAIDLRLNIIPTLHGEDLTVRLLVREMHLLTLAGLGLPTRDLNALLGLLRSPSGLILVTGPTGAGKTTTLYACLNHLNNGERKINTIEDPVEYVLPGVRQSQVNLKLDTGFPELLRSVLRQAPDVIMVGEVRDPVTAETAVRAANSGHLVLATLHAPLAAGAIQSMLNLGLQPFFLASCLRGVIAQRLVRTLCKECKTIYSLEGGGFIFEEVRPWLEPGQGDVIYSSPGCDYCHRTGYTGRTGVFEVLTVTKEVRRRVAERATTQEIHQAAVAEGLIQVRQSALLKVAQGQTSVEEVMRAIPAEHLGLEE